jgi:hypothetical protein
MLSCYTILKSFIFRKRHDDNKPKNSKPLPNPYKSPIKENDTVSFCVIDTVIPNCSQSWPSEPIIQNINEDNPLSNVLQVIFNQINILVKYQMVNFNRYKRPKYI